MKNEGIQGQDHARGGGGHLLHLDTGSYCIYLKTQTKKPEQFLQNYCFKVMLDSWRLTKKKKKNANVLKKLRPWFGFNIV